MPTALRKHEACRSIFEKLPEDSIDVVHRYWQMKVSILLYNWSIWRWRDRLNKVTPQNRCIIKLILFSVFLKAGDSPLTPEDNNTIREYLCIKAYLVSSNVVFLVLFTTCQLLRWSLKSADLFSSPSIS